MLDTSEVKFTNLAPKVFDVDHVAKIRSRPSITVLEKKKFTKLSLIKSDLEAQCGCLSLGETYSIDSACYRPVSRGY